jgi:hypothetical protein
VVSHHEHYRLPPRWAWAGSLFALIVRRTMGEELKAVERLAHAAHVPAVDVSSSRAASGTPGRRASAAVPLHPDASSTRGEFPDAMKQVAGAVG